jgi:hypothetical protein
MKRILLILLAGGSMAGASYGQQYIVVPLDATHCDTSSANFQAAVQRAAQDAIQAQIDDAQWYRQHLERGGRPYSWGAQYDPTQSR